MEEGEEQEQNAPPAAAAAALSVGAAVPLPGSIDVAVDTGDVGIWEGSSGWL